MKFKNFFLALALALVSTFAFAGDVAPLEDTPKDTVVVYDSNNVPHTITFISTTLGDDAECTVTATISILGQEATVSATAETCSEARRMVQEVFE
ncbi:hypothetical protein [Lewinella sp. W8]|uniref:hypothetical protein n=1 Tax=Lewinella sp. W8 TaxID=2528208 RepID=UPI001067DB53|nr:hypothetical protein [Lewinella sp. W8]MTB50653.1 hypothetical protein [Lewinella sp. W8]